MYSTFTSSLGSKGYSFSSYYSYESGGARMLGFYFASKTLAKLPFSFKLLEAFDSSTSLEPKIAKFISGFLGFLPV